MPNDLVIRPYESADEGAVVDLWRRCELTRTWNDPLKDIQRKLGVQPHLFLVGLVDGQIVASVMAGFEGHRGWVNYLAVDPEQRRKGYARELMANVEQFLLAEGCPKINLQVRHSNTSAIEFYRRIGFTVDEVTSLGKRLEHDQ